jgi:Zn-dependent alcohol dehydrogenase
MTKATPENPVILGMEGAGIIESVSQGETKFQVGQKAGPSGWGWGWFSLTRR